MKSQFNKAILPVPLLIPFFLRYGRNEKQPGSFTRHEKQSQLPNGVRATETNELKLRLNLVPENFELYNALLKSAAGQNKDPTLRDRSMNYRTLLGKKISIETKLANKL